MKTTIFSGLVPKATATPLFVFFLLLSCSAIPMQAQVADPILVVQTPEQLELEGDLVLAVTAGTAQDPIPPGTRMELRVPYHSCQLDPDASVQVEAAENPFFFDSAAWLVSKVIDTLLREIHIVIQRPADDSVGGYGSICTITVHGGIIIVIDPDFRMASPNKSEASCWKFVSSPTSEYLSLRWTGQSEPREAQCTLTDLQGRVVIAHPLTRDTDLYLGHLPRGTYAYRIQDRLRPSILHSGKISLY